jgi:lipid-A-disaccharide synthase
MRYYLIAGEPSGDLHASRLMKALKVHDPQAEFRYFGGDLMAAEGGTLVKHYRELAYMGFIPVLLHLPTILRNMKMCKEDIKSWHPDVVILVDYPGFNLDIAKFVKAQAICPVYYYIAPKIWAWKEYRIKAIRRDVDELFSILPFEVEFFEQKHHFPIHYVGNPTMNEVEEFLATETPLDIIPDSSKKIVAILAGSRRQEIKDNLPAMVEVARAYPQFQFVVAGAPGIEQTYYDKFVKDTDVLIVRNQTYALLRSAHAALVTSGTATLETCLFNVPQVVCYETPLPVIAGWVRRRMLHVKYVSLVNLIANREVVPELVADTFSVENIKSELAKILDGNERRKMLDGYAEVRHILSEKNAPDFAAQTIYKLLNNQSL